MGEGMPRQSDDPKQRLLPIEALPKGDLYIRFNINFPRNINNDARLKIIEALEKNELELV